MAYQGLELTTLGISLLSRAHVGEELHFVRVAIGDGQMPVGTTPEQMTALVHERKNANISGWTNLGDGTVRLRCSFSNQNEITGWAAREIGVFALNLDIPTQEILYAYATAGDMPDWVPAYGSESVVEHIIDLIITIRHATSVTVRLTPGAFVLTEDLAQTNNNIATLSADQDKLASNTRLLAHFM